ncbi:hypothetical protein TREMEDRAFT_31884 [Tremella mesenterica DSM 1558]|uniref:uncharacterized protein n=1 Tax=Tremella mesenterica (strain ATCC 24925 / CBS 8224 / DSM 1558 / NBRC 9311 / NRRL Y-6157 / RJB 2259-6 / UBC 559-6) TaxID=578456 RepID=UPI0003F4A418|nr:uncharacterized protein TREMEDRAFT_31884 [Tremella mesenterica DSM 1558]EIW68674.1 hypothetical protein TREMEDRAFT_31884 [Tremella mesenterica DSM 1558]
MTYYRPLHVFPLPPTPYDPQPWPTALTVDPTSDLLWVGSSSGLVSALCSPLSLHRNVQFPVVSTPPGMYRLPINEEVKEIRMTERDVWTLTLGGMTGRKRGGQPKWIVEDKLKTLNTMTPNPINSHEVLAGGSGQMLLANASRGEVVRYYDTPSPTVKLFSQARNVVCASLSGQVNILDPRTGFKPMVGSKPFQAHTGGLSGADLQGNLVATWGWTHRQGHPLSDTFVRVYDVRTLRSLPPVTFPEGAAFCLLHPTDPMKMVVTSQQGFMQNVDTSQGPQSTTFQPLNVGSFVTSMALSPMGDYLVFGEGNGNLHLWTTHDISEHAPRSEDGQWYLPPFNGFDGTTPEWPDDAEPPPMILWTDDTPLNLVGMPVYTEPLLSNFPPADYATDYSPFYNSLEPIPDNIQAKLHLQDGTLWARLGPEDKGISRLKLRPIAGGPTAAKHRRDRRQSAPRFRSERRTKDNVFFEDDEEVDLDTVPKYFKKVEIKYSKFGVEDFDFAYYNDTSFSGLETDILNSYTNALLQALHYTIPVRAVAKAHICVDCKKEHCLLCEAGFLFRMLEDAKGINCQASNFSRAFSATPQAVALGLLEENTSSKSTSAYGNMIQNFNRWLLSTFSTESIVEGKTFDLLPKTLADLSLGDRNNVDGPNSVMSAIDQIVGVKVRTTSTCAACGYVTERDSTLQAVDLQYPKNSDDVSFSEILASSVSRDTLHKASCLNCKQFARLNISRRLAHGITSLPPVLSVNAKVTSPAIFDIWKDHPDQEPFLPTVLSIIVGSDGDMFAGDGPEAVAYQLRSLVIQVQDTLDAPSHLVAFAKIDADDDSDGGWVMFNDFVVRPISEETVFSFPADWKTPAVCIFERVDVNQSLDLSVLPKTLDLRSLLDDVSMARHRRDDEIKHVILSPDEMPKPGTTIAIDAEFVLLQPEEMEFRSDGTKNVLRPSHMSLARVSVLRGEGQKETIPFIDDYIHTKEVVVDYLTEFSGIQSGDLDPELSPHTLVPLKVAYKKLRLLVDMGCVFVGHGLAKDFRTINIFVPPSQVMDTVNLFVLPKRQRKLSLRFLSWYLLQKDIQTSTHDSIEDAEYALLLYKLYRKYQKAGKFEELMEDIFSNGAKYVSFLLILI